jgi:septation ring formation regulator EzrA
MEPKDIAPMEPKDFWTMYLELQKQADALSNELTELQIRSADVSKQLEHVEMTMRHLAPLTGV